MDTLQQYRAQKYNEVMGPYQQQQQWQAYQDQLKQWSDAKNKDHAQVAEQLKATTEMMNKMRSEMDSKTAELAKKAIDDAAAKQREAAAAAAAREAAVAAAEADATRRNKESAREATTTATKAAAVAVTATAAAVLASTAVEPQHKRALPRLTGLASFKDKASFKATDHKQRNFDEASKKLTALERIKQKSEALKTQVETILTKLEQSLSYLRGGGPSASDVHGIIATIKAFKSRIINDDSIIASKKNEAEIARNQTISARTDAESDHALQKVDDCLKASQELLPLVEKATEKAKQEGAKVNVSPPDPEVLVAKTAAKELAARYETRYEPPHWSLQEVGEGDWFERAKKVRVYHSTISNPDDVIEMVRDREPVNMEMKKYYHNATDSGYTSFFKRTNQLAPNFALYLPAKVSKSSRELYDPKIVHVLNVIGFAFDVKTQPDYLYFLNNFNEDKKKEFQSRLTEAMTFVFVCAKDLGLKQVCLPFFGGNYFAKHFNDMGYDYRSYFVEALRRALSAYPRTIETLILMGRPNGSDPDLLAAFDSLFARIVQECSFVGTKFNTGGYIPHVFDQFGTTDTLYVNSWDPHSVVGNGNGKDIQSLDGVFGIHSDMGYMSYSKVNSNVLNRYNLTAVPLIDPRVYSTVPEGPEPPDDSALPVGHALPFHHGAAPAPAPAPAPAAAPAPAPAPVVDVGLYGPVSPARKKLTRGKATQGSPVKERRITRSMTRSKGKAPDAAQEAEREAAKARETAKAEREAAKARETQEREAAKAEREAQEREVTARVTRAAARERAAAAQREGETARETRARAAAEPPREPPRTKPPSPSKTKKKRKTEAERLKEQAAQWKF